MKQKIFYILWAALCAWLLVKLALWLDTRFELTQTVPIAPVIGFIHDRELSGRKLLFLLLAIVFLVTGVQKIFGHWLLTAIGIAVLLFITVVVLYFAWTFMAWMSSTL